MAMVKVEFPLSWRNAHAALNAPLEAKLPTQDVSTLSAVHAKFPLQCFLGVVADSSIFLAHSRDDLHFFRTLQVEAFGPNRNVVGYE
jgi:hypothetical protein